MIYIFWSLRDAPAVTTLPPKLPEIGQEDIDPPASSPLACYVNRDVSKNIGVRASRKVECLLVDEDVYLPFKFFKNYYELVGAFVKGPDESKVSLVILIFT